MPVRMPLLLLHDIYIPWVYGLLFWGALFGGLAHGMLLLVRATRGKGASRRPPLPVKQMWLLAAGTGAVMGFIAAVWAGDSGDGVIVALLATITAMGVESVVWLIAPWNRARDAEASSCEQCRRAAEAGGVPPLDRIGHNADGPRFLYQCAACHSYWEKAVKGMEPISALRVRADFSTFQ